MGPMASTALRSVEVALLQQLPGMHTSHIFLVRIGVFPVGAHHCGISMAIATGCWNVLGKNMTVGVLRRKDTMGAMTIGTHGDACISLCQPHSVLAGLVKRKLVGREIVGSHQLEIGMALST